MVGVGGSPGAFAEYVRVDQRETVGSPRATSIPRSARWSNRSRSDCTRSSERHIRSGDKVLVVGAGPVGLSVIAWAARSGAGELVVSDPSAVRREAAAQFGATRTVDPEAEPLEAALRRGDRVRRPPGHDRRVRRRVQAPRARRDRRRVHQARSVRADHGAGEGAHRRLRRVLHAARVLLGGRRARARLGRRRRRSSPSGWRSSGADDAFTELIEAKDQRKILVLPS